MSVVGEAHYQANLERCSGGRCETGARVPLVTAELIPEPDNEYDRRAIRVEVAGACVGYIPREETRKFHPVIEVLGKEGRAATCRAWLIGGWDRGGDDRGNFGIVLSLHPKLETITGPPPMLPFGRGRLSLVGEEQCQDFLLSLLGRADKVSAIATLAEDGGTIAASIDGTPVGRLTPKMAARYVPLITELRQAGHTDLSCEARIVRGAKKADVFLKVATPWDR